MVHMICPVLIVFWNSIASSLEQDCFPMFFAFPSDLSVNVGQDRSLCVVVNKTEGAQIPYSD